MRGEKYTLVCENCGKEFIRYKCQIKPGITHFFCSRECAKSHLSIKMTKLNQKLNPTRMDYIGNRIAVSEGHRKRNTGNEHSYVKFLGVHEHRLIAEDKLGRLLKPGEVVHHIDGNPRNNNQDNLEILSSQAEHCRKHFTKKK